MSDSSFHINTYHEADFPMGLMCPECGHVFEEGEEFSLSLVAFQDDIPLSRIVCQHCARGGE